MQLLSHLTNQSKGDFWKGGVYCEKRGDAAMYIMRNYEMCF